MSRSEYQKPAAKSSFNPSAHHHPKSPTSQWLLHCNPFACCWRWCKPSLPFLYTSQTFSVPPHAPAAASLIPTTLRFMWFPENKGQCYGVGWGRLLYSEDPHNPYRAGRAAPIPATGQQCWLPSSQQQPFAFLLLFALEQQLKLSTKIELATMHTINTTST